MRYLVLLLAALLLAGCGASTASGSPSAAKSTAPKVQHWSHAPAMAINANHRYTATVQTTMGTFTINLLPKVAPIAVNSFVFLARHHFFDGVIFHRVVKGFMIQGGDPLGTGYGGPGYAFKSEKVHQKYTPGTVAMANSGPNTNGSQFFIVVGPRARSLPPSYPIFGHVGNGMSVVMKIASVPVMQNPGSGELSEPVNDIVMKRVTVRESP